MRSGSYSRLLIAGLLGLLLGACAATRATPTPPAAPLITPAPSTIGCFEGLQVAATHPTAAPITAVQAEERARAQRPDGPGALGAVLAAELVTVTAGGATSLHDRPAWLLTFAFTPPPGQPPTPPPGLAWRAYSLVDATSGRPATSCVGLVPHPERRP